MCGDGHAFKRICLKGCPKMIGVLGPVCGLHFESMPGSEVVPVVSLVEEGKDAVFCRGNIFGTLAFGSVKNGQR